MLQIFIMESKDLTKYKEFRKEVQSLMETTFSIKYFSEQLKREPHLKSIRNNARRELQTICDIICKDLSIPRVKVFLPIRKSVHKRGLARSVNSKPEEIRIYPIVGPSGIPYSKWSPKQLVISSKFEVLDTLVHEIAHVIVAYRHGDVAGHGREFVAAYDEVREYMRTHGYEDLIKSYLELSGVPPRSFAAAEAARRHPAPVRKKATSSSGCLILLMVIIVATILTFYNILML